MTDPRPEWVEASVAALVAEGCAESGSAFVRENVYVDGAVTVALAAVIDQIKAEARAAALEGHLLIPVPQVAPLGVPVDKPEFVQEVWDAFIKPRQDSGELQSAEERVLMAILRAVYAGLGGE